MAIKITFDFLINKRSYEGNPSKQMTLQNNITNFNKR